MRNGRLYHALIVPNASKDARTLLAARGVRAFGDGFVSVLLPLHLGHLGFSNLQIGAIATVTLAGSAALTLLVGLIAYRLNLRQLLVRASVLMVATGVGFALFNDFWPLIVVAFLGTLNPSSGDVSVFLPTEQALLPRTVSAASRTDLFARYSLVGALVAAAGSLAAGVPELVERSSDLSLGTAFDGMYLAYAALGLIALALYERLSPESDAGAHAVQEPLGESRGIVYCLAALFSLDAFAGGFVVQSMLALWLFERFDLSVSTTGTIFFFTNLLAAFSFLASARLAKKIGLVNTMVFTHLPANLFLVAAAFMPTVELAVLFLLLRAALSSMDVPARTSYVMAVVTTAERPAAASMTSVPRSLAAAFGPFLSGALLGVSSFGWPLLIGGSLKAVYDLILLRMFQKVHPPEEA